MTKPKTKVVQITVYPISQATHDAQFISLLIEFSYDQVDEMETSTLQIWYQPYMFIETFSDSKTLKITSENGFDFQFIKTTNETFIQSEYTTKVFVSDPTLTKGIEDVFNNSENLIPENFTIVLSNDADASKNF